MLRLVIDAQPFPTLLNLVHSHRSTFLEHPHHELRANARSADNCAYFHVSPDIWLLFHKISSSDLQLLLSCTFLMALLPLGIALPVY